MNRLVLILASALAVVGYASSVSGAEITRYDFRQKQGEGGVAIFRLEVDKKASTGRFCFSGSWVAGIDMDVRDRIYDGEPWSRLVDMSKIQHACANVYMRGTYGGFYTPKMKLGKNEYMFVFVGEFTQGKMTGEILVFFDVPTSENGEVIRSSDRFDVDVAGTRPMAAR